MQDSGFHTCPPTRRKAEEQAGPWQGIGMPKLSPKQGTRLNTSVSEQMPGVRGKLVYNLPASVSTNASQQDGAASKMTAKSEDLSSTLRAHLQDRDSCPLTSM